MTPFKLTVMDCYSLSEIDAKAGWENNIVVPFEISKWQRHDPYPRWLVRMVQAPKEDVDRMFGGWGRESESIRHAALGEPILTCISSSAQTCDSSHEESLWTNPNVTEFRLSDQEMRYSTRLTVSNSWCATTTKTLRSKNLYAIRTNICSLTLYRSYDQPIWPVSMEWEWFTDLRVVVTCGNDQLNIIVRPQRRPWQFPLILMFVRVCVSLTRRSIAGNYNKW